jgi:hypothetical protein
MKPKRAVDASTARFFDAARQMSRRTPLKIQANTP